MKKISLILDFIGDLLMPAFGLICLLGAGNLQTRFLGIGITMVSFLIYKENRKEE